MLGVLTGVRTVTGGQPGLLSDRFRSKLRSEWLTLLTDGNTRSISFPVTVWENRAGWLLELVLFSG